MDSNRKEVSSNKGYLNNLSTLIDNILRIKNLKISEKLNLINNYISNFTMEF